jgi:hypothetical protein
VAAAHGNAERCWSGRRGAAVGFGSGAREMAKELEKWNVGTHVVLVRARDRSPGICCELSTAAVRWRPTGVRGNRGARGAGQRGGATAAGKVRVTRGEEGSRR